MILDTIPLLTDSTLIESVHLITNDTLIIKVQQVASTGGDKSSILDYILKNGITILLALIAGLLALYQVKSNIIATARIKRIDDLRTTLSELYDAANDTLLYYVNKEEHEDDPENCDKYYDKYAHNMSRFNILSNKVKMSLDSSKPNHLKLENLISEVDNLLDFENISNCDSGILENKLKEIVLSSKDIFSEEWNHSKKLFSL